MQDFVIHNLRHTASTHLTDASFNSEWSEKCLVHETKGIRGVYNGHSTWSSGGLGVREAIQEFAQLDPWRSMSLATQGAETSRDESTRANEKLVAVASRLRRLTLCPTVQKKPHFC